MSQRNKIRVGPATLTVEIRPGRHLRVQHFNFRKRDDKFENEMQMYIEYKKNGALALASGPMTMPKQQHKAHSSKVVHTQQENTDPHSPTFNDNSSVSFPSSIISSPHPHLSRNGTVNSASSVQVYLDQQQTFSQKLQSSLPKNITVTNSETNYDSQISYTMCAGDSKSKPSMFHTESSSQNDSQIHPQNSIDYSNKSISQSLPKDFEDMTVFFIHGVGGSSDIWCAQYEYFANQGVEVIVPDLIGHGLSSAPKNSKAYHFKEIAADLASLFDKRCKRRNIVIGHSYGSSFASYIARYRPRRVTKLILVSGGPPTPLAPQPGIFSLPTCLLSCINPCLKRGFYKGAFHKPSSPNLQKKHAFNVPTYVLQNLMNGQDWPEGDEIFHRWLTCPCLLIYGSQDKLVSREEEDEMIDSIFDCKLEVIQDAGHMVMMEAPEEVNRLIHGFIVTSTSLQEGASKASPPSHNTTANAVVPSDHPDTFRSKSRVSMRSIKSSKGLRRSHTRNLLSQSIR